MPVKEEHAAQSQMKILREPQLWFKLFTSMVILAGMFATYGYLAEYLGKISQMSGAEISIMLLVFGGTGIIGNWLTGILLSKNVMLTSRLFLLSLVLMHLLAYQFGGFFIPMVIVLSVWGFIHTGGFLVANVQITSGVPTQSLELVNSLLASFFNAGITLGTLLGGYIIARYGIHEVIWISIPLLLLALGFSFVTIGRKEKAAESVLSEAGEAEAVVQPVVCE
jgi:DHA1 family inner membrane transport protein